MVALRGIGKYFAAHGINALDKADFDLLPGEIHALLGENGAGKSTLMHIMAGYLQPGTGRILVNRRERRFNAPAEALAAGIGMVRQHPRLVPGFTVWEDCVLGAEPRTAGILNRKAARTLIRTLSERWGFALPLELPTERLTVSQRQKSAVLSLLLRNAEYLIFDEPTAVLTPYETEGLFSLLRRLREEGKGIVLISHKLEETLSLADRVTILRKGKTVAVRAAASLEADSAGALMFGMEENAGAGLREEPAGSAGRDSRGKPAVSAGARFPKKPAEAAGQTSLLSVRGLCISVPGRPLIRDLDLELGEGEILGIAGVRDSGLETLELALTGFLRPARGTITLRDREIAGQGPGGFRAAGGAYLSAETAAAARLSIRDSIIIHAHRRARRGLPGKAGIMDRRFLDFWTAGVMNRAQISLSPRARGDSFSGGMLQRIALARELAENAALLVLAEPGRGLDRNYRRKLTEELRFYVRTGRGALVFSTDVDELLSMAGTVLVLRNGGFSSRVSLKVPGNSPELLGELRERIGRAMVGGEGAAHD
jgi:simple sugar transport system ATP-binding protein